MHRACALPPERAPTHEQGLAGTTPAALHGLVALGGCDRGNASDREREFDSTPHIGAAGSMLDTCLQPQAATFAVHRKVAPIRLSYRDKSPILTCVVSILARLIQILHHLLK